ncbi:C2 domain [Pseudocohnilembus persalinus]|uniref:C2 domain n=1 Tax=Pseudocohnilembus persalinus TaxID=266149 RepID=A0A0V0R0K6_PSEPJ|nr:C2 domain [Pseudocohnilembus persalinus]|eukprot:KRX08060.1 C2 domain [Pseudocohnilembus persalinus]
MQQFQQLNQNNSDREKIELFISCRSLLDKDTFSKSDPYVVIQMEMTNPNNGQKMFQEIGRTEVVKDNLNPNFQKSIQIDYIFEIQQHMKFQVWDYDSPTSSDFIGEAYGTVSKIMGSKNTMCILDLKDKSGKYGGKVIIRADKVTYDNNELLLQVSCKSLPDTRWFGKTNPFLKFSRISENTMPLLVFQSEPVMNTCNPLFPQFKLSCQKLCNGDYNLPLLVEAWDFRTSGEHVYLGQVQFSINDLTQSQQKQFKLKDSKKKKDAGYLEIRNVKLIEKPSFVDFIRGGTSLNLVCAIDFTGSNGVPSRPESLHALQHGQMNQYQQAILGCGDILLNYDSTKHVPVYGFGQDIKDYSAKPRLPHFNTNQTLHCFPVNGYPQKPEAVGLQGIMESYTNILRFIELSGPTLFNPLIQEAMKLAQSSVQQGLDNYFILLILTDGAIHDMDQTKSSIVDASHLPLSIIIVGIGNEDFGNMEVLDGDQGLFDERGRKAQRDLVQFVPFNKFKGNPHLLAQEVLYELPDQVVEYKRLVGQKAKPARMMSITDIQVQNIPQSQENFGNNLAKGQFFKNIINNVANDNNNSNNNGGGPGMFGSLNNQNNNLNNQQQQPQQLHNYPVQSDNQQQFNYPVQDPNQQQWNQPPQQQGDFYQQQQQPFGQPAQQVGHYLVNQQLYGQGQGQQQQGQQGSFYNQNYQNYNNQPQQGQQY